jgi:hypothetical protein
MIIWAFHDIFISFSIISWHCLSLFYAATTEFHGWDNFIKNKGLFFVVVETGKSKTGM